MLSAIQPAYGDLESLFEKRMYLYLVIHPKVAQRLYASTTLSQGFEYISLCKP